MMKKKGLALKASTSHREVSDEYPSKNSENLNLLVKKFFKFMKKKGRDMENFQKKSTKKSDSTPTTYTCFECAKQGHIRSKRSHLRR